MSVSKRFFAVICLTAGTGIGAPCQGQPQGSPVSLSLGDVLQRTLAHAPAARIPAAQIAQERGARRSAGAIPSPMLSYETDGPGRHPDAQGMILERETMASASFSLEAIYQRGARVRGADAGVRRAEADSAAAMQQLALDVSSAFYQLGMAQVRLQAALAIEAWLDTLMAYNRARADEGAAADVDVMRSGLERDRAGSEAALARAALVRASADLGALVDSSMEAPPPSVSAPDGPFVMPVSAPGANQASRAGIAQVPGALLSAALVGRPDLRAARERVSIASAAVSAQRSLAVRELGATIGIKRTGSTTALMLGGSVPLPTRAQYGGEVARAEAERDAASLELVDTERKATADVAAAYASAALLTRQVDVLDANYLRQADDIRRIALGTYAEGAAPLFQTVDAIRASSEARLTYYETLYGQQQAVIALLAAQGADLFTAIPALTRAGGR